MKSLPGRILSHRFGVAALIVTLLVAISLLTRIVLMIKSFSEVDFSILNLLGIFILGFFYDLINAGYFIIPLMLYLWLVPDKLFRKNWHRFLLYGIFFFFTFGLLFNAVSEFFFWDEFNSRFNFIAVDYLVYTTEVIGNIRQSYPIEIIIVVLLILTGIIVYFIRPYIKLATTHSIRFKKRTVWALGILLIPFISFFTINNKLHR